MRQLKIFLLVFILCFLPLRLAFSRAYTVIIPDEEQPVAVGAEICSYTLNEPAYHSMKAVYIYLGIKNNNVKIKKRSAGGPAWEWREEILLLPLPKKQMFWSSPPKKQTLLKTEQVTLVITVVDDFGRITVKELE